MLQSEIRFVDAYRRKPFAERIDRVESMMFRRVKIWQCSIGEVERHYQRFWKSTLHVRTLASATGFLLAMFTKGELSSHDAYLLIVPLEGAAEYKFRFSPKGTPPQGDTRLLRKLSL